MKIYIKIRSRTNIMFLLVPIVYSYECDLLSHKADNIAFETSLT